MESLVRPHSLGNSYPEDMVDHHQQSFHDGAADPFVQAFYGGPESPRSRSRASSIASQSSASFSAHTDPTEDNTVAQPPKLHPGDSEGFLVELDSGVGESGTKDPGLWRVAYSELIALLSNPATIAKLSPDHPVSRIASFVKEEPGLLSSLHSHPAFPSQLPQGRTSYSNYHAAPHDPYRGASSAFESFGVWGSHAWEEDARSSYSLPYGSRSRQFDDTQSISSYPPPSSHLGAPRRAIHGGGFAPPLPRGASAAMAVPSHASTSSSSGPSPALAQLEVPTPQRDQSSGPSSIPAKRYSTRDSVRPYPNNRSRSTTYDSDYSDATDSKPTSSQPLRALNRERETYVWREDVGQLFRVTGHGPVDGEVIVFPAGSYYKVYREDMEIIPSDPAPRANDWVRAQVCVPECTGFRIANKRPATVRHHFASCRLREVLDNDPLGRLCKLQIDALRRAKEAQKKADQPTYQKRTESNRSRTTSYTESNYSEGYGSPDKSGSEAPHEDVRSREKRAVERVTNEQAAMAFVDRSTASAIRTGAAEDANLPGAGQWNWQANYGAEAAAAETTQRRGALADEPSHSGSFLSMEE